MVKKKLNSFSLKNVSLALAGVAQRPDCQPVN